MSFKNFSNLNNSLRGFTDTTGREAVNIIANAIDRIRSLASSAASNYAKAYSQVQWMKYDQNGNPTDVTPSSQNTVPDAVLNNVKQEVENAVASIASLESAGVQTTVQVPMEIGVYLSSQGFYATDTPPYMRIGAVADGPGSFAQTILRFTGDFQASALPTIFYVGIYGHRGVAASGSHFNMIFATGLHNGNRQLMLAMRKDTSKYYVILFIDAITSEVRAWLPTSDDFNQETTFDPNDTSTFSAFLGSTSRGFNPSPAVNNIYDYWDYLIEGITLNGESMTTTMIQGQFPATTVAFVPPAGSVSDASVTVSSISPQALVNGYDELITAIRTL